MQTDKKPIVTGTLVGHKTPYIVYGKTGKAQGVVVDCWFTGFVENENENLYFCAYLGETEGEKPSSTHAKEIALDIRIFGQTRLKRSQYKAGEGANAFRRELNQRQAGIWTNRLERKICELGMTIR